MTPREKLIALAQLVEQCTVTVRLLVRVQPDN